MRGLPYSQHLHLVSLTWSIAHTWAGHRLQWGGHHCGFAICVKYIRLSNWLCLWPWFSVAFRFGWRNFIFWWAVVKVLRISDGRSLFKWNICITPFNAQEHHRRGSGGNMRARRRKECCGAILRPYTPEFMVAVTSCGADFTPLYSWIYGSCNQPCTRLDLSISYHKGERRSQDPTPPWRFIGSPWLGKGER